jgi:hypothetical protein
MGLHVHRVRHNVIDAAGQFHDPKGVLETAVRRPGIEEMREGELMDVAQPLHRPRIQNLTLQRLEADEDVNRIPDFMDVFCHRDTLVAVAARFLLVKSVSDRHGALMRSAEGLTL